MRQTTISQTIEFSGIGIHSGAPVNLQVCPAAAGAGYLFERSDLPGFPQFTASHRDVTETVLATRLGRDGAEISTIEHMLSALAAFGIDNALIRVDGPELPAMDGSAREYCEALAATRPVTQSAPRRFMAIRRRVEVHSGDKWMAIEPADAYSIEATIDFTAPAIGRQTFALEVTPQTYVSEIAAARTFGMKADVEMLHQMGLGRGGSMDNAIIVDGASILNPEGLRFGDEFVRHKILDIIGDLSLAGYPLLGHVTAYKSGHGLHLDLVRAIWSDPSQFAIVDNAISETGTINREISREAPALY